MGVIHDTYQAKRNEFVFAKRDKKTKEEACIAGRLIIHQDIYQDCTFYSRSWFEVIWYASHSDIEASPIEPDVDGLLDQRGEAVAPGIDVNTTPARFTGEFWCSPDGAWQRRVTTDGGPSLGLVLGAVG